MSGIKNSLILEKFQDCIHYVYHKEARGGGGGGGGVGRRFFRGLKML